MPPIDNEIRGRLALITGASGGIGAAIAKDLYSQGVHLALTYSTNQAKLDDLISLLQSSHPTTNSPTDPSPPLISSHHLDLTSTSSIQSLLPEIATHHPHPPDILIPAAGHGFRIPDILDIPLAEFDRTLSINLRASFLLTQLCVPHMRAQRWGRIVYISSIAAHGGGINGCHYAASKGGVMAMAANLGSKGLAGEGVTVNDVAPAMIGGTGLIPDEERVRGTEGDVARIPVGRLGSTDEVANVVTMLCRTGYLTGQSIVVGGGLK